ncbi:ankyrin repeat-containing protein At5g02620-like isoform X2 [Panicum virgatum]|uniref:PGG domain-containing protein n=1 Tax=Panicum virgatum TaxID=38727 RepID=A0A8T0SI91_PANVG|nr:ankyrin repeat-containing protein At5g02620-like isoform X2 [Panicum virgatum]KAG2598130.1 hypothetical protein PVAP13_5KG332900 [Panicum virgatum]
MESALYKAATQGKVERLRQLVVGDPSILKSMTAHHDTALHLAAWHGHVEFAREVLDWDEELFVARNDDGNTPLHLAAKAGRLEVAELLVRYAVAWPQDEISRPLSMTNYLSITNYAGNSALHEAVRNRMVSVAVALLSADPSGGYALNARMESPLQIAAREGLFHVVQRILDYSWVEQEYMPSPSGTALHQAVLGIVAILLEKRPHLIDLTDAHGNNALHYAAEKNHPHAVEVLLRKRMELAHMSNGESMPPLHVAVHYGSTDAIKALLRICPDVVDGYGRNAFHASATFGNTHSLRWLLRHVRPAEPLNRVDIGGNTPLHKAASMSHVQCALLLLRDRRVDPCIRNHNGQTARSLLETKLATGEMNTYEMELLKQLKQQESLRCRMQNVPPAVPVRRRPLSNKDFDSVVDSYFLAATLITTVSFAATFTMPGGYDQTSGITLHAHSTAFRTFVVSNTVAMCSSIVVIFLLIWARQEPVKLRLHNLFWSQILTVIACLSMLLSLMTTVYITVAPKAPWPAYAVIAIATSSPALFFIITWIGTW